MFGQTLNAKLRKLTHQAKNDDGLLVRHSILALYMEFTKAIATGIDEDCQRLQKLLCDKALKSASVPMTALTELRLVLGDGQGKLQLDGFGLALDLKEASAENAHPQATFTVGFTTEDEPVLWVLHHLEETLEVHITKKQLDLPNTGKKVEAKPKGKGAKKGNAKQADLGGTAA